MNMATIHFVVITMAVVALAQGQRPSFAGSRPIGFPEVSTTVDPLGNRFGETGGTTERLPIEAKGDRGLVERISKLPIDQQPFWYLNWKALEAQRKNPQTYPQRPSQFGEPLNINAANSGIQIPNRGNFNSNTGTPNSNSGTHNSAVPNSNSGTQNSAVPNSNSGTQDSGVPNSNSGTQNTAVPNSNSGTQNSGVSNSNVQLGNRNGGTGPNLSETTKPIGNYRTA